MDDKSLINLGFVEIKNLITRTFIYEVIHDKKATKILSIGGFQTPNEIVAIGTINPRSRTKEYEDIVIVHNYDYDGYISLEKIKAFLFGLTGKEQFK